MRSSVRWVLLAFVTLVPISVSAQDAPPAPAPAPAASDAPAPSESGAPTVDKAEEPKKPSVTPGYSWTDKPAAKRHWKKRRKIDSNAPQATYPGFRMKKDGTSEVWVQISQKVTVTPSIAAGHATFVLTGVEVGVRNNRNPLITEYFDTPLAQARLRRDKAGAQLVLVLREAVQPTQRIVDGPAGTMILYIDLPKATKKYSVDRATHNGQDPFDRRRTTRRRSTLPPKGSSRGPTP